MVISMKKTVKKELKKSIISSKPAGFFFYCEFIKNIYVPLLLTQLEMKIQKTVPYA